MTTIWGDEGNECDLYSALPGMLYQAEGAYTRDDEVDAELLRRKFDAIVGADLDDWVYASKLECVEPLSSLSSPFLFALAHPRARGEREATGG